MESIHTHTHVHSFTNSIPNVHMLQKVPNSIIRSEWLEMSPPHNTFMIMEFDTAHEKRFKAGNIRKYVSQRMSWPLSKSYNGEGRISDCGSDDVKAREGCVNFALFFQLSYVGHGKGKYKELD